jgi:hypothetical protein
MKILNDSPNESKEPLLKLHKSLNTNSIEEVLSCIEAALGPGVCDMILRKPDKKKERYTRVWNVKRLMKDTRLYPEVSGLAT